MGNTFFAQPGLKNSLEGGSTAFCRYLLPMLHYRCCGRFFLRFNQVSHAGNETRDFTWEHVEDGIRNTVSKQLITIPSSMDSSALVPFHSFLFILHFCSFSIDLFSYEHNTVIPEKCSQRPYFAECLSFLFLFSRLSLASLSSVP